MPSGKGARCKPEYKAGRKVSEAGGIRVSGAGRMYLVILCYLVLGVKASHGNTKIIAVCSRTWSFCH